MLSAVAIVVVHSVSAASTVSAAPRSLAELGRRFQVLRQQKKRGEPGRFDRVLDNWEGELHKLMIELGDRLGVAGTKTTRLVAIMGEPDDRKPERWVYLWRGWHDYLFFELHDDRVVKADWYLAGE
jgi:hypothetical protein